MLLAQVLQHPSKCECYDSLCEIMYEWQNPCESLDSSIQVLRECWVNSDTPMAWQKHNGKQRREDSREGWQSAQVTMRRCAKVKKMVRASGRMLCGPTSNLAIFLLPLRPVLISSDHCRFPEKATSGGAPHLPHLHLHLTSSSSGMQSTKHSVAM